MVLIDLKDVDLDNKTGGTAYKLVKEGRAHFLVAGVEQTPTYVKLTLDVVAHEDPTEVGSIIYDRCALTGKWAQRGLQIGLACGIITRDEIRDAKKAGKTVTVDFAALYGKTFCASVKHRDGVKKTVGEDGKVMEAKRVYSNVGWDFRDPRSDEALDYPINKELLRDPEEIPF